MSERRGTKALELWCRRIIEGYPNVKIENMTTSWRDGLAFCAMIHHFRPDLINFEQLNKSEVYYNNTLAFTTAEKYLGIPALLDADDMAAYEVPDRLSILTYLSQFYQVFAAQEAHNRLKRSSSAAEETQITKASGPPSKMAHVVGVPKRDPCRKCQLPVFLAERLLVGKKVYHRTCLKCARCGYQLTPGSFYETETDEQYCCETCPDEEVNKNNVDSTSLESEVNAASIELRKTVTSDKINILESSGKPVRSSIKDRLAFFENQKTNPESDTKFLQKSLSDEEKSKSLKKVENLTGMMEASYKTNAALSNFLNNSIDSEEDASESSLQNSKMETSDSEDDTEGLTRVCQIPELPKSMPPIKDPNIDNPEEKGWFSVSTQLVLDSISTSSSFIITDEQENRDSTKENSTGELRINASSVDNSNNNINGQISTTPLIIDSTASHQTNEETVQLHPKIEKDNIEIRENNDNYCATKDKSSDQLIADITNEDPQLITQPDKSQSIKDKELTEENFPQLRTIINNSQFENNKTGQPHTARSSDMHQLDIIANKEDETFENVTSGKNVFINEEYISEQLIIPCDINTKSIEKSTTSSNDLKPEEENLDTNWSDGKVPLETKTKDNERLNCDLSDRKQHLTKENSEEIVDEIPTSYKKSTRAAFEEYPQDLNPFESDEEEEKNAENNKENVELKKTVTKLSKQENLNPFDSSDDEIELEKAQNSTNKKIPKVPPPRPPPPRISKNPFGSDDEDQEIHQRFVRRSSLTGSQNRKTPIPTPRLNISHSQNPTPEPTPRVSTKVNTRTTHSASTTPNNSSLPILQNCSEFYGSANSLYSNNATPYSLLRNSDIRSSNNSLNLSSGGTIRSRKSRRAPLPPAPVKELFPSNETVNSSSKTSTPSSSTVGTPKSSRKKRPAPAPPKPARLEASQVPEIHIDTVNTQSKNLNSYPLQSELDSKLSDEEKALLEGKALKSSCGIESDLSLSPSSKRNSKRLITLDKELLEEHGSIQITTENNSQCDDLKQHNQQKPFLIHEDEPSVVYRRVLIPSNLETPTREHNPLINDLCKSHSPGERQMEKLKDNKEANNRNRQSQISVSSSVADDIDPLFNKSAHGKWKRRKGPAPALPLPPRKVLQMLPLQEIKHELEIIEVQQQGLEKQGVILEKMIRDRCEGENGEPLNANGLPAESEDFPSRSSTENSKEVENLILQLFELVNEKNELFRRQAELMYLRRQHRLEQEQADLEYEIRILMAQPERNKTDSDKAREEALIERLLEVVQLRNEVVDCLEMDRLREAEEDQSIKQRLESHIAKRDDDYFAKTALIKLSKKEKKKQKEAKKLFKNKKLDADKDADESELNVEKQKSKKKKKLLIF